jgi:hypothetical protein
MTIGPGHRKQRSPETGLRSAIERRQPITTKLLLPGAFLVAVLAHLLAAFMLVNLRFPAFL